jgi:FAD:protein FMN transferase
VRTLGSTRPTRERSFRAIGTTATVVVADGRPEEADRAEWILRAEIDLLDRTCSRFRTDSELANLCRQSGKVTRVSSLLFEALTVAVRVAEKTGGAVDPTVGNAMTALGYDRDFQQVVENPLRSLDMVRPAPGYACIQLDAAASTVQIPRGVLLDLGSSAKAFGADRSSALIADQIGLGVLVSIGGDLAVSGRPPSGGWPIGIAMNSGTSPDNAEHRVAIQKGGLASSGTQVRSWMLGAEPVHHIVDPATGYSSSPFWTLVSACGPTCVDANALSTAAIVWGEDATRRLQLFDQAVRLVRHDGAVITLGGWPRDSAE